MQSEVPLVIFQFGLVLSLVYYAICLVLYYLRRDTFPIKQQSPKFSLSGLFCSSAIGTVVVVSDAFPYDTRLSGCKTVMQALISFVYAVQIIIVSVMFWIGRRYFMVNISLRNQQAIFGFKLLEQEESVGSCGGKILMKVEDFFLYTMTKLKPNTLHLCICAIFVTFGIADFALLRYYAAQLPDGVLVHTIECYPLVFVTTAVKFVSFLVSSSVMLLMFGAIVNLNDNLGLGNAVRILLGNMSGVVVLLAGILYKPAAIELMINTKLYGFFLGLIFMPAAYAIRGYYYIWLSYKHEKRRKMRKVQRASMELKSQSIDRSSSERIGSSVASPSIHENERILQEILLDPAGKKLLQNFMQKEFSVENLMFIEACSAYEACFQPPEDGSGAPRLAMAMVENFVRDSGAFSVNIPYNMRNDILDKVGIHRIPSKGKSVAMEVKVQAVQVVQGIAQISAHQEVQEEKQSPFNPELFAQAKKEIKHLILKDTFSRFKMSEEYTKWAEAKVARNSRTSLLQLMRHVSE
jgi:hypothetical protein